MSSAHYRTLADGSRWAVELDAANQPVRVTIANFPIAIRPALLALHVRYDELFRWRLAVRAAREQAAERTA